MSITRIQLWKLLRLLAMPDKEQTSQLRIDARQTVAKEIHGNSGGMDFYSPLWSDIKSHVLLGGGIVERTQMRIDANPRRDRIYKIVRDGFIGYWPELRNSFNGPIRSVVGEFNGFVEAGDCHIKVESLLSLESAGQETLHIYPYIYPDPTLSKYQSAMGLAVLNRVIGTRSKGRFCILDIARSKSWMFDQSQDYDSSFRALEVEVERIVGRWLLLVEEYRKKAA